MHVTLFAATLLNIVTRLFGNPISDENFVKCTEMWVLSTTPVPCVTCSNVALNEVPHFGTVSPRINQLLLERNNIKQLVNNTFSDRGLINLERIDLSHNLLVTIELGAFNSLKSLTYLEISFNNLASLSPAVFSCVQSLTVLSMEGNPLNKLTSAFALKNLATLDMTNCNLKTLPNGFFDETPHLERVYLSKNQLSGNFGAEFFNPLMKKLKMIELQDNMFTRIPTEILSLGVGKVNLERNPWHCDCDFFKFAPEQINLSIFKRFSCDAPRNLKGYSLAEAETYLKCDSKITEILSTDGSHSTTDNLLQSSTFEEPLVQSALERRLDTTHEESLISHPFMIYFLNIALSAAIIGILLALAFYVLHTRIVNYYSLVRGTQHCYKTLGHNTIEDRVVEPIYEVIH